VQEERRVQCPNARDRIDAGQSVSEGRREEKKKKKGKNQHYP
jgi:hypothetical protein